MAAEMAERIGERVRERRVELHLTQAEVARRMAGTTTSDQVSRWERGRHQPQSLDALAKALEVDVSYFYTPAPTKAETPDLFPPASVDERLDRMERRLSDLIEQQNDLLQRQSEILERIEAAIEREDDAARKRADADEAWVARVAAKAREALVGDVQSPVSTRRTRAKSGTPRG